MLPEDQKRILGYFIEEAKDHLNTIEQGLLNLQTTVDDSESINEVFRAAHSVKGGAAMLGLESIQHTSHRMEDYFKVLKENRIQADRQLESMLLQVFDGLQEQLEQLQGPFGLTEDKAGEIMGGIEPLFQQVDDHLEQLVQAAPAAPVSQTRMAAVSDVVAAIATPATGTAHSEASALHLVFKSDVPGLLRDMLGLFKQADNAASRQQLQAICQQLHRMGEQFELANWCYLTNAAAQVVTNQEQTYRTIAPVVIKELKTAQSLVLQGLDQQISVSESLQELLLVEVAIASEAEDESLNALLNEALSSDAGEPDLVDLFGAAEETAAEEGDDLTEAEWLTQMPDPTAEEGGEDFAGMFDSLDESPQTVPSVDEAAAGPAVGAAELNSLASLFEGEGANFDQGWEEEVDEQPAHSQVQNSLDADISDDFADLLLDEGDSSSDTAASDDLASLFGTSLLDEPEEDTVPSPDDITDSGANADLDLDFDSEADFDEMFSSEAIASESEEEAVEDFELDFDLENDAAIEPEATLEELPETDLGSEDATSPSEESASFDFDLALELDSELGSDAFEDSSRAADLEASSEDITDFDLDQDEPSSEGGSPDSGDWLSDEESSYRPETADTDVLDSLENELEVEADEESQATADDPWAESREELAAATSDFDDLFQTEAASANAADEPNEVATSLDAAAIDSLDWSDSEFSAENWTIEADEQVGDADHSDANLSDFDADFDQFGSDLTELDLVAEADADTHEALSESELAADLELAVDPEANASSAADLELPNLGPEVESPAATADLTEDLWADTSSSVETQSESRQADDVDSFFDLEEDTGEQAAVATESEAVAVEAEDFFTTPEAESVPPALADDDEANAPETDIALETELGSEAEFELTEGFDLDELDEPSEAEEPLEAIATQADQADEWEGFDDLSSFEDDNETELTETSEQAAMVPAANEETTGTTEGEQEFTTDDFSDFDNLLDGDADEAPSGSDDFDLDFELSSETASAADDNPDAVDLDITDLGHADEPLDSDGTDKSDADLVNLDDLDALVEDEEPIATTSEDDDEWGDLDALVETSEEQKHDTSVPEAADHSGEDSVFSEDTISSEEGFEDLDDLLSQDSFEELEASTDTNSVFDEGLTAAGSVDFQNSEVDDEFEDLEKLLEEADQLGGSAPVTGMRRSQSNSTRRTPRRSSMMIDQTMRVSVHHLDNLSNLVGELVVNRNSLEGDQERLRQFLENLLFQVQQLNDVGQRMRDLYERSLLESSLISSRQAFQSSRLSPDNGNSHATGASFDALEMDRFTGFHTLTQEMIELIVRVRESASDIGFTVESTDQVTRQFRQVTTQLQEGLNKARMVPFAQTADRLPRAVRDISLKCGKEAKLVVEGRDTLIDKMILERLYDPMTHLVNNAITHGIETPEERTAAGKSREGTITIRAFYQGNQTVIYIADDGGGINSDLVREKALARGIITPTEAREMTEIEIYELLFLPGFSTRDQADDFAGRGVGMDVVRTTLAEIRGAVTVDSEPGRGTSFTIRLPLTLSISKALSCVNNQARIAFPMDGVEDMFDAPRERIQENEQGQSCVLWRDTLLPFRPLSDLLQFNRTLARGRVYGGGQEEDTISIVVLRSANTCVALQVDQVIGEQEIVIKQLEGPVPKPLGIAGATVLGDGRVMPIADVLELIDLSLGRMRREPSTSLWVQPEAGVPEPEETKSRDEATVLIVDDSITVRELLSMSFNKVGYRVEQARDGQEAWEKLRSGLPCDLVFCDIEMPRMDGLELLSRMQKDNSLSHIPIAMLTSRGADRHRQMAVDLGAKGYFTKPYLEEMLLDAAQRMLNGENMAVKATPSEA